MSNSRDRSGGSAEDAAGVIRLIKSGMRVFVHGGAATPTPLLDALAERARELSSVTLYHVHLEGPIATATPEIATHIRSVSFFTGSQFREGIQSGWADFMPVFLSDVGVLFESKQLPLDAALLQLSPPDSHGYCTLGTSVDIAASAAEAAPLLLAEINDQMPRTHGTSQIHLSRLAAYCHTSRPLPVTHPADAGQIECTIAGHIRDLIPDGATLQIGIGSIPNAVLRELGTKNDLGLHTEMFSDGVLPLLRDGVITNKRKRVLPGVSTTGFIVGSRALYDFVDDNPAIHFAPSSFTNDTSIIRKNPSVVAINGALQIDVTGQVCADSIGTMIYSGIGGQMDFMRGSALSPGGVPIIALPSTARSGTVSRIVRTLSLGAGVVTTRGHIHWVVTEYGAVNLHGKCLRERAELLSSIAHPDFREHLRSPA